MHSFFKHTAQNNLYNFNHLIKNNFAKIKPRMFLFPTLIVILFLATLYYFNALNVKGYLSLQKGLFYIINHKLSKWPNLQYNLTQFGDAFVVLSLLTVFIIYASNLWAALLTSSIISAILSKVLKTFFNVPRPASFLSHDTFNIIGEPHVGPTSSLPSGHSITIFAVIAALLYAFMPKEKLYKFIWCFLLFSFGLMVAFSRVGVGAHFPLDVIAGSLTGYFSGLLGVLVSTKFNSLSNLFEPKYYLLFLILILGSLGFMLSKILRENLVVYYITFLSLLISLYAFIKSYSRKEL